MGLSLRSGWDVQKRSQLAFGLVILGSEEIGLEIQVWEPWARDAQGVRVDAVLLCMAGQLVHCTRQPGWGGRGSVESNLRCITKRARALGLFFKFAQRKCPHAKSCASGAVLQKGYLFSHSDKGTVWGSGYPIRL